ncbi:MAG: 1-acyl-sn-glycerol-3-phosphate acyltransferase, partial [Oscillospiraceae bacterium]|nr:1-acyl-sn-glycerol-3-phosphate acyltransferase [Oscillospiraceae bacterium]
MIYILVMLFVRLAMHIWFNLKFEGREHIDKHKNYIYVSNHRSYADPVLVALAGYGRYGFMAKKELFENKLFAGLIRWLGAFPVERGSGDTNAIDMAVKSVQDGRNLLIFPEGTRSKDGRVGRGKAGVALVASKVHADIIPVGINFEGEKLHFRSKVIVKIGEPIRADSLPSTENLSERELLKTLRTEYIPPIMNGIKALVN